MVMSQTADRERPWVGRSVPRVEDRRFLRGEGTYTDDLAPADALRAVMVRSPHAHARVVSVDAEAARAMPGVAAVFTHRDVLAAGMRPIPTLTRSAPYRRLNRDGSEMPDPPHWPLAADKVRHVGDPVAMVVAQTLAQALDAAERVEVDYEALDAVVDAPSALAGGAARVWDDLPGNQSFDYESGDPRATDQALRDAAHTVRVEVTNHRVVVAFMEPRAVIAQYDPSDDRYTLHLGGQSPHTIRDNVAYVLGIDPARVRAIVPDTGGGFGARNLVYPEFPLAAYAARKLGRPVKWTAERSEGFMTDSQARDQRLTGELALDAEGRFLGLRVESVFAHGAYLPARSLWVHITFMEPVICGVYSIPAAHFRMRGVFTNRAPVAPLRGVARAEAMYLLERLVDAAARVTGIDRVELRRRNLIHPVAMPWTTPTGATYGNGQFERNMDLALDAIDWKGFSARRAASENRNHLRGIGLSVYIENAGGAPSEFAEVAADPDGTVTLYAGTKNFGMAHETVYAQVLADELGVPLESIRVTDADTDEVRRGFGAHGSRSMRIGGAAVVHGARKLVDNARQLAADLLEAAPDDIGFADGRFTILGTDRSVTLFEAAAAASARGQRLRGEADFHTQGPSYPNGAQACEVEIDPETGKVTLVNHVVVADPGRAVNPMVVHGQLHGGLAQGIGQAVLEEAVYEPGSGQLLTGSFMDYTMPRADDMPPVVTLLNEVLAEDNPLGVKGVGEGPTTGSPPAVMNAVVDALSRRGITHLDMPATAEKIWRALRGSPDH